MTVVYCAASIELVVSNVLYRVCRTGVGAVVYCVVSIGLVSGQ